MFKHIKESLERIEKGHKEDKEVLHKRINNVETCINKEIKPDVHKNSADIDWIKRGFWYLAGVGSSALLLVIGVIVTSVIGG